MSFSWRSFFLRLSRLIFGLFLFGLGTVLVVHANVGLAPWDAWGVGFSLLTGLSLGLVVILTGVLVLGLVLLLHESVGIGTLLNILLIGAFIDMITALGWIPLCQSYITGIPLLLAGQLIICVGSFFYIGAGFGCGPRDSLMVAIGKRLPKVPVGVVRSMIEGIVLLVGFFMGAKVGIGTVIAVVGIGFLLQFTFRLLKFDVKAIKHDNIIDTLQDIRGVIIREKPPEESDEQ